MYSICLSPFSSGAVIAYSKSTSIDDAVRNAMNRLFQNTPFSEIIRELKCNQDIPDLIDSTFPFQSDFGIVNSEDDSGYFFLGGGAALPDTICMEVNEIPIPLSTPINRPVRIVQPIVTNNLLGKTSLILVKPRIIREILNAANTAFQEYAHTQHFANLDAVLARISTVIRGISYTNMYYPKLMSLNSFVDVHSISQAAEARSGKKIDIIGIEAAMNYNSLYSLVFKVSRDADVSSIRALFYFISLIQKFVDTDQILYGEFGINPQERVDELFAAG